MKSLPTKIASIVALGLCLSLPGRAQIFTGADGVDGTGYVNYNDPLNWSTGSVPNLTTATTATIAAAANYEGATYGDLNIGNGGVLEVTTGGSWTQVTGNNYLQLRGGGTVLVDGGTFNQGTVSSNPFNLSGSSNAFTITSGVANFSNSVHLDAGLNYSQTGGTVNALSGEFDVNSTTASITGGVLNATLFTTVNGPVGSSLQFSGGQINLSSGTGIYTGGAVDQINFTLGSYGVINFEGVSAAGVESYLSNGIIDYNNAVGTYTTGTGPTAGTDFTVISTGDNSAELVSGVAPIVAAPEPSTYAMLGAGLLTLVLGLRRRTAQLTR